jgi:hypothetical protein
MERARNKAKAQETADRRLHVALAITGLVLVGLAVLGLASRANAARDPSASAFLEGGVKQFMQTNLAKQLPGLKVTRVTCFVPTTSQAIQGKCTALFTVSKYGLKGIYRLNGKLSQASVVTVDITSKACTDMHGRRASCDGQTNSGNGLLSAQLAETQLLTNGFTFQNAAKKAKTAFCTGSKAQKWVHGKFDDVFSQFKCVVTAADGKYNVVLKMAGAGYNLPSVTKAR